MPIEVECPKCGAMLRLEDRFSGKQVECTECGSPMMVPEVATPPPAREAQPGESRPPEVTFEDKMAIQAHKIRREQHKPFAVRHTKGILLGIGLALLVLFLLKLPWLIQRVKVQADISLLKSGSRDERRTAAKHLAKIVNPTALPALLKYARDGDKSVRVHCLEALGTLGNTRACGLLIELLGDEEPVVRREAAWALASCGTDEATRPLTDLVSRSDRYDPAAVSARYALYRLGDTTQYDKLLDALLGPNSAARHAASNALIEIGKPDAIPVIEQGMKEFTGTEQAVMKETVRKLRER